jgi:di/tricarboxylate transporter
MAVVYACSFAFLSPVGHQSTVLVMGPGKYTFRDFARAGAGLSIVLFLAAMIAIPLIYPL